MYVLWLFYKVLDLKALVNTWWPSTFYMSEALDDRNWVLAMAFMAVREEGGRREGHKKFTPFPRFCT